MSNVDKLRCFGFKVRWQISKHPRRSLMVAIPTVAWAIFLGVAGFISSYSGQPLHQWLQDNHLPTLMPLVAIGFGIVLLLTLIVAAWIVLPANSELDAIRPLFEKLTLEQRTVLRWLLPLGQSPVDIPQADRQNLERVSQITPFVSRQDARYLVNKDTASGVALLLKCDEIKRKHWHETAKNELTDESDTTIQLASSALVLDHDVEGLDVGIRGFHVCWPKEVFEREEGYGFDETVTGGMPLRVYVNNNNIEVDAAIYDGRFVELRRNKLMGRPSQWQITCHDNTFEITNEKREVVFQMALEQHRLTINGIFSKDDLAKLPANASHALRVAYDGGRYNHKVKVGFMVAQHIIRLQLENKTERDISEIRVKAESFNSQGTILQQVPLRIQHDEKSQKSGGFSLAPGEKEMVDVVERTVDYEGIRLCSAITGDYFTNEDSFKIVVVVTAKELSMQRKKLRVSKDDVQLLRCDALKN